MEKLSEYTLDELLEAARRLRALDDYERVNDSVVFRVGNQSIVIQESRAKSFARGLVRGHFKAARLDPDREDLSGLK